MNNYIIACLALPIRENASDMVLFPAMVKAESHMHAIKIGYDMLERICPLDENWAHSVVAEGFIK